MTLGEIVFITLAVLIFATITTCARMKSRRLVRQWALENDLHLERQEYHLLGRGPFEHVSRTQYLWAVRTRDKQGRLRDAWLNCGHPVVGMLVPRLEVKWVDEGKSAFLEP